MMMTAPHDLAELARQAGTKFILALFVDLRGKVPACGSEACNPIPVEQIPGIFSLIGKTIPILFYVTFKGLFGLVKRLLCF